MEKEKIFFTFVYSIIICNKINKVNNLKKEFHRLLLLPYGKRKIIFTLIVIIICNKNKKVNELYKKRIPLPDFKMTRKKKTHFTFVVMIIIYID